MRNHRFARFFKVSWEIWEESHSYILPTPVVCAPTSAGQVHDMERFGQQTLEVAANASDDPAVRAFEAEQRGGGDGAAQPEQLHGQPG